MASPLPLFQEQYLIMTMLSFAYEPFKNDLSFDRIHFWAPCPCLQMLDGCESAPETGATEGCEVPGGEWKLSLILLQEQPTHLSSEPFLRSLICWVLIFQIKTSFSKLMGRCYIDKWVKHFPQGFTGPKHLPNMYKALGWILSSEKIIFLHVYLNIELFLDWSGT